ncbi:MULTISPECIES: DUF4826 family protein [Pseudoalteromonas]|jgi:hypothetical protein|uniref:DUF4826 domain-containing protein n=1 Tax=Pseudoalteromonas gelatinilytica TaxID=1703256 RepID=A0ABQ1TBX9_9GAMM|nr:MULTISPECIES: DUF4826 family protein [Pseudoalteromonas]GGE88130.1 DUF4826 domain-containing protein [Pseudoalteromonas profundi]
MEQKQARPLTPEEQAEAQKQSVIWQRECFQNAQKHLAEKGIIPQTVMDKECRFIAPLVAVWKFKAQNGKVYWVINGRLPADHAAVEAASSAREALRYFSMQWQLKADQIMQSGAVDKTKVDFANLLINRAHGLYDLFQREELWQNEPA